MLRKSKYTFLIHKNDDYLIYNAARNNFWATNKYVYDMVRCLEINNLHDISDERKMEQVEILHSRGIVTTEDEDNSVVNKLRIKYLINAYSQKAIGVTILPTISCNLACPYCFEVEKPVGMMTDETCDKIIEFIKRHANTKYLAITWFGGEPLIGIKSIERFLNKLKDIKRLSLTSQTLITNGTLLDDKHWNIFKEFPLSGIQITLDGEKETHDKRRVWKNGAGTYDLILKNLQMFTMEFPDVHVSVRVNIDKNNSGEFMHVYKDLKTRFSHNKNVFVYPGILKGCGMESLESPFLKNKEIAELQCELARQGYTACYPSIVKGGCTATCLSSYVIGPRGEIYKCWEDVGIKEREIGSVYEERFTNQSLLEKYVLNGSHMNNPECWECRLLPICKTDCAKKRLENLYEGKHNELCSMFKDDESALNNVLYMFYKSKNAAFE